MSAERFNLPKWVDHLERSGRYAFTLKELHEAQDNSSALEKALQRLCVSGRLVRVRRGFYVLVPLAYASAGCIPTEWFIDDLMQAIEMPYYLGSLSAAAIHGAAHQRPQELQVVVPGQIRNVVTKYVRIRFLRFGGMGSALVSSSRTQTGDIPVSTPEWTAIDLVRFQKYIGGIDAVATLLEELVEVMDAAKLAEAANIEQSVAYLQRLGWLLDFVAAERYADRLAKAIEGRKQPYVLLQPSIKERKGIYNPRWGIVENEIVEVE